MSTLILSFDKEHIIEDVDSIQFSYSVGNTIAGWPSAITKATFEVNGGPSANGYYHSCVVLCDTSQIHGDKILKQRQSGVMEVGSKSHAQNIIAGLEKAIEMGWLK